MAEILTPRCPLCDQPPMAVAATVPGGVHAAFCGNDDCTALCWDPALSLDDNLLDAGTIHLPPMDDTDG